MALPSGADPRTEQQREGTDPRTGTHSKRNVNCPCCPVSFLSWQSEVFLVSARWFFCPVPACSCLCFRLLFWPWASCSSSRREGRRVKRKGADPRTGLFRYPPLRNMFYFFSAKFEEELHGFVFGYLDILTAADDCTLKCVGHMFVQFLVTGHFRFPISLSPWDEPLGALWRPHHFLALGL